MIRGLWRILLSNEESKMKLITEKLRIHGEQSVNVYADNPFRTRTDDPNNRSTRITVKDLPTSYGNDELTRYLEAQGVKVRSIQFARARNPRGELTRFINGDRIVFSDKLEAPLPRVAELCGGRILIFHDGQPPPRKQMLCTKCFKRDHQRRDCAMPEQWCRLCQTDSHQTDSEECPAITKEPQSDVRTVYGHKDPISNHYLCDIRVLGQNFASAEHGYMHTQAINAKRADLAKKIMDAKYAHTVKNISQMIPFNAAWEEKKEGIMEKILRAKKDQVPTFREALHESEGKALVGAVNGDFFWGSGMNALSTQTTKQEYWPGKNALGKILETLRAEMGEEDTITKASKKSPKDHAGSPKRTHSKDAQGARDSRT